MLAMEKLEKAKKILSTIKEDLVTIRQRMETTKTDRQELEKKATEAKDKLAKIAKIENEFEEDIQEQIQVLSNKL